MKHLTSVKIIIVCETFCGNFGCIRVKQKIKCDQIITVPHPPPPSIPAVDCDVISPTQTPGEQSGSVATLWFLYQTISHKKSFPSECKLPEAARSCPPSPRSSRRDQAAVITAELQQPDCNNSMDAGVSSQRNFFQLSREHRNKDLIENMPEII